MVVTCTKKLWRILSRILDDCRSNVEFEASGRIPVTEDFEGGSRSFIQSSTCMLNRGIRRIYGFY
jgi:hypothetical protein